MRSYKFHVFHWIVNCSIKDLCLLGKVQIKQWPHNIFCCWKEFRIYEKRINSGKLIVWLKWKNCIFVELGVCMWVYHISCVQKVLDHLADLDKNCCLFDDLSNTGSITELKFWAVIKLWVWRLGKEGSTEHVNFSSSWLGA